MDTITYTILKAMFWKDDKEPILWVVFTTNTKLFKVPVTKCAMEIMRDTNPEIYKIITTECIMENAEKQLIGKKLFMPEDAGETLH